MKNKTMVLSLITTVLVVLFIFYATSQFDSQLKIIKISTNPENIPNSYTPGTLYTRWNAPSNTVSVAWIPASDVFGYRLEKQMEKGEWQVLVDNYTNTHYDDTNVLLDHTYYYRLFARTNQGTVLQASSYAVYPESKSPSENLHQPALLEQISPIVQANVPFYELHVNDTHPRGTVFYLNCERTGANCNTMLNRKFDVSSEYAFGYKNGTEVFAITEQKNATVAFVQKVNPEISSRAMQINPTGQIIIWYPLYLHSKEGSWGRLALYDNGTIKFVLGDPPSPKCSKC